MHPDSVLVQDKEMELKIQLSQDLANIHHKDLLAKMDNLHRFTKGWNIKLLIKLLAQVRTNQAWKLERLLHHTDQELKQGIQLIQFSKFQQPTPTSQTLLWQPEVLPNGVLELNKEEI